MTRTERFRQAFWYWDSLISNLAENYNQVAGPEDPDAEIFLDEYIRKTRRTCERVLRDWETEGLSGPVLDAFHKTEKAEERQSARLLAIPRPRFRQERKEFLEDLQDFLEQTDAPALYVVEMLSNESSGQAALALTEKIRQDWEGLCSYYKEEDDEEWEEEELPDTPWLCYGMYMLTVMALVKAVEIEQIYQGLPASSEFLLMLSHTMEEYRSITQVMERTYDIYELHFAEETGRILSHNEYLIFLTYVLLLGNDHLYGSYYDSILPLAQDILPIGEERRDRRSRENHSVRAGAGSRAEDGQTRIVHPEVYIDRMKEAIIRNQAGLDFAHPKAPRFYMRSIGRLLTERLSYTELFRFAIDEKEEADAFAEELRRARLNTERERFVEGDFSGEHLFNQNVDAFRQLSSGVEFEQYLNYIFTRLGYESHLTRTTGDQGADLVLRKNGIIFVVQAKFYDRPVGNKAVQEAAAALRFYEGNRSVVVTNNTFTNSAISLAKKNDVMLIDGKQLEDLVRLAFSERASSSML
ncbi:MAG: restriction endonuclease [Lachnospiraceae bacterium]|nr:restriction endonuclease [Lachnospiraceae bacterium]